MLGEKELLALAKKHLDLPHISDRIVPKWYLQELEMHLRLYPDDINFIVKPDSPGKGLGTVTCLEKGCARRRISLGPRATADDGGLKEGFGSLKAYREHIMDSASHAASWPDNAVEIIESTSATRPGPKYKAPLGGRDTSTSTSSSSVKRSIKTEPTTKLLSASQSSSGSRASSSRSRAMPEVVMSSVPRKRGFTSGSSTPKVKPDPDVIEISDDDEQPVVKRLKKESSFSKKPLSQSNSFIGSNQLSDASQKPQQNVDDIREQLSEIQKSIVGLEVRLARYRRKSTQTKADKTHVKKLQQDVARLERQKAALNARLPSTSHVTRGPSFRDLAAQNPEFNPVKKEPRGTKLEWVEPRVPQAPVASGSNVRLPPTQQTNTPVPPGLMFKFKLDPDVKMVGAGAEAVVAPAYRHRALDPPKPKISPKQENPPKQEPPKQEIVASKVAHYDDPADSDVEMGNYVNGVLPPAEEDERYDEQGNFYGRGRDMFQGPTAKADDIDRFLVEAGNAEQFDGNANVAKALEKLQLPGLYAPIPGMQIALMPHQVIGVTWMLEREKSYSKGGCLSDEMGLGKTVQTLATMVANRSNDPRVKTTLIVAPVALLDQWQMEVEMKTDCGMKCYIYHGSNKIRKMNDLLKYDVVLTSFHTLAHEWPDPEEEERKQKKAEKEKKAGKGKKKNGIDGFVVDDSDDENAGAPKKRTREKKLGLLMQTEWYRVILDEGQNIRNKKTRVSRAVTMLESTYRWVLTGTPIINSLTDAYALLRFLKIRPWYDWDEFHKQIGCHEKKNPKLASSRLQAIFAAVLLRRKKDSMLDGKRLVELPPKSVELVRLEFTAEEREIYSMVEAQSQAIFNRFLRAGTVLKNYHQVLVLLLRLRQICDHPCLIQESDSANAFIVPVDESDEGAAPAARSELARARELISDEFVARMKYKLREAALQRMEAEKESKDATVEPDECPICFDTFTDAVVTPCTHIFCKECILNVLHLPHVEDANDQHKYKAHERPCPTCRSAISGDRLFTRAAFEPTDEDLEAASNAVHPVQQIKEDRDSDIEMLDDEAISDFKGKAKAKPKRTRRKSKTYIDSEDDSEHEDLDDDLSDFIAPDDEDDDQENGYRRKLRKRAPRNRAIILDSDDEEVVFGRRPKKQEPVLQDVKGKGKGKMQLMSKFLPSTKMKHMMDLILQWAKDHPDEKTLVISQWTQCLQLVSDYMVENAVAHVKYQGDMDRNNRDKAVRVFMSKESAPVMLMSLKCGGVGLNLTRANRVISLDLAWSEAIESQAFDRVHRLGQNRHVQVHRLVIANTVEDRVLGMQERKKTLADGALGEGTGKKIGRLSVKELANLFGLDHRGRVL